MSKLSFTLFSFFIVLTAYGQEIEWQKTIGGSQSDNLYSIIVTSDGGYFLGGTSDSQISGDKTENSQGAEDYWVVKLDSMCNIEWQNTIGGSNNDLLHVVLETSDGGFLLGGQSNSPISGDKVEDTIGNFDYWIVKLDSGGNIQWQNTIGGDQSDELFSMIQASDNGYVLGGYSNSSVSGDKTEPSPGGVYGYWIVKLDTLGNILWQNTITYSDHTSIASIVQTSDGGYFVGGTTGFDINYEFDYRVSKLSVQGNLQWTWKYGGSEEDILNSAIQTTDGGYILGGWSNSPISGDKTENTLLDDYWLVKINSSGAIQWQNTIEGANIDVLSSVRQSDDGGYLLGGYSNSNIYSDKTECGIGSNDFWIIKTDSTGEILWQNTIGGSSTEHLNLTQITADGGYIIGGSSNSDISGDKSEQCKGSFDFWIIKVTDQNNQITGNLFIDANNNSIKEPGEIQLSNKMITELNTGRVGISDMQGNYSITVFDTGSFMVSPGLLNYYTAVPNTNSAVFSNTQQTDSINDFAFQPAGVFNDVCVSINPTGPFRAGFNAHYVLSYSNVGTTNISPTVIFYPDTSVTFVSASPAPTSVTPDSVVWTIGNITPFQTGSINVTVNVNTGTPIGTLINSGVVIEPIAGDANTQCNQSYWEIFTTGSSDPNDILVDQDTLLSTQFPNPPYLEYLIRFQNTGNDTAFIVKVLNPIDTFNLDLSTFEFVASSHPTNISWIPWERNLQFQFDNILLPDSNVNEALSHGFVRYRIKPRSNLTLGDSIQNFAAIYFDFNAPVLTNTAITEVVLPTGIEDLAAAAAAAALLLYPNPAADRITIQYSRGKGAAAAAAAAVKIEVYNTLGEVVKVDRMYPDAKGSMEMEISGLSYGMYLVRVQDEQGLVAQGRFVKM